MRVRRRPIFATHDPDDLRLLATRHPNVSILDI